MAKRGELVPRVVGVAGRPLSDDEVHRKVRDSIEKEGGGITDGPAYRDLQDPGAALFHISVQDMDTAMGWFRSDTFKASKLAKVTGRSFYLAQPQT